VTEPILLFGATGYTGRLVAGVLEHSRQPFAIAGRDRASLEHLSVGLASRPEVRVADAGDRDALLRALAGMKTVVATAGPFLEIGMPVAAAAVDLGVHYVDTTGEQLFQINVYEQLHRRAVSTGATIVTGAAFQSAIACLGAAVLHERCGPLVAVRSYHLVGRLRPSRGSLRSALAISGEELSAFDGGRLVPLASVPSPVTETFAGERDTYEAVAIPGGDAVTLPLDIPSLRSATSYALLPRFQARIAARVVRAQPRLRRWLTPRRLGAVAAVATRVLGEPPLDASRTIGWKVFVRGESPTGTHLFVASGSDIYRTSAAIAVETARRLAEGRARDAGVMTIGKALPAIEILDALRPHGVRWELR